MRIARNTVAQATGTAACGCRAYDRHVRSRRLAYRRRRDQLVSALARHAPTIRVRGVAAGLHTVLELPPGTDEAAVIARAQTHGLALGGLGEFRLSRSPRPLVVSFVTPPDHAFSTAVARLCAALKETITPL